MSDIFIWEVFRKNKFLFLIICLFITGQVFFSTIRIHNFPFFIYDMYSRPEEHKGGSTSIYEFYINGKRWNISNLNQYQQATVIGSINSYIRLHNEKEDYWKKSALKNLSFIPIDKKRIFNSKENLKLHSEWLTCYVEKIYNDEVLNLTVNQVNYKYISKTILEMKNSKTVFQYP